MINNRPKKKLGYATTMEFLAEKGLEGVFSLT
jgi:IS30 family transposase